MLLFIVTAFHVSAGAQTPFADSFTAVKFGITRYRSVNSHFLFDGKTKNLDTALRAFQQYDTGYLHNLGVLGSVVFPLRYEGEKTSGFRMGFDQWQAYAYTEGNERYYETQNPYADFFYSQGAHAMQLFKLRYAQNIRPNWNFSVRYQRQQVSQPAYDNERTSLRSVGLNTWYNSPNGRYRVFAAINNNTFIEEENGGLRNDSAFRDPERVIRVGLPVLLSSARQNWSEQDHQITNILNLGKRISIIDSTGDSARKTRHFVKPGFYIAHKLRFKQQRYQYTDGFADTALYNRPPLDSAFSNNRYLMRKFSNDIIFSIPDLNAADSGSRSAALAGYAYLRLENIQLLENARDIHTYNLSVGSRLDGRYGSLEGQYFLSGYNQNDYKIRLNPLLNSIGGYTLGLTALSQRYTPAYTDLHFNSNRLNYEVQLDPVMVNEIAAQADFAKRGFGLNAAFNHTKNFIYYLNNEAPQQLPNLTYGRATAYANLRFGILRLRHELTYQRSTDESKLVLPEFIGRLSYYIEGVPYGFIALTPNAITAQLGADLTYISKYEGLTYFPLQARFTVQNNGYAGGYPYLDLWAAAKIKTFFLFVKLEHANQGFTGQNYMLLKGYPMHGRLLRLGIRWVFLN